MTKPTAISFTVFGTPRPAGSKRSMLIRNKAGNVVGTNTIDANPKATEWKGAVSYAARLAYNGPLLDGPIAVSMTFYVHRPKCHYRSGRHAGVLKPSAPKYPTGKPDVLKLARGTEDALSGVIWTDDCRNVTLELRKRYGDIDRADIEVRVKE